MPRSARTSFYLLRYCPQSIFADRGPRLTCDPLLMGCTESASIRPTARRVTRTFEEGRARMIFFWKKKVIRARKGSSSLRTPVCSSLYEDAEVARYASVVIYSVFEAACTHAPA